jgi:hypothetical protein
MPSANIPVLICKNPFNVAAPADQTLHRGGIQYVAEANSAAGGGPLYVAILSGSVIKFDPLTGVGVPESDPGPGHYTRSHYLRFDGVRAATQPGFDWVTLDGGDPAGFTYTCFRTDGQ